MNKFKQMPIRKQLTYSFSIVIVLLVLMAVSQLINQSKTNEYKDNISKSNEIAVAVKKMKSLKYLKLQKHQLFSWNTDLIIME